MTVRPLSIPPTPAEALPDIVCRLNGACSLLWWRPYARRGVMEYERWAGIRGGRNEG